MIVETPNVIAGASRVENFAVVASPEPNAFPTIVDADTLSPEGNMKQMELRL